MVRQHWPDRIFPAFRPATHCSTLHRWCCSEHTLYRFGWRFFSIDYYVRSNMMNWSTYYTHSDGPTKTIHVDTCFKWVQNIVALLPICHSQYDDNCQQLRHWVWSTLAVVVVVFVESIENDRSCSPLSVCGNAQSVRHTIDSCCHFYIFLYLPKIFEI